LIPPRFCLAVIFGLDNTGINNTDFTVFHDQALLAQLIIDVLK
jgi:hypothetical protein